MYLHQLGADSASHAFHQQVWHLAGYVFDHHAGRVLHPSWVALRHVHTGHHAVPVQGCPTCSSNSEGTDPAADTDCPDPAARAADTRTGG